MSSLKGFRMLFLDLDLPRMVLKCRVFIKVPITRWYSDALEASQKILYAYAQATPLITFLKRDRSWGHTLPSENTLCKISSLMLKRLAKIANLIIPLDYQSKHTIHVAWQPQEHLCILIQNNSVDHEKRVLPSF